ncbi:MAG: hypothetical protein K2P85_00140 [Flavobacteriaceae bacterium]|nr:hypothetical protein [Flavobacteriaceae bacterium]
MPNPILIFHYEKSVKLTTKSKTFREAVKFVLDRQEPTTFTPTKIVAESTGKIFYFDELKFKAFIAGDYTESEIIKLTECDGLFRNTEEVSVNKNDLVDPGALWKLQSNHYVLIDEDRYICIKAPNSNFIEI